MNSLLSGVLLALTFPKFNLFWLAWVALVPFFLVLLRAKDIRSALFCGFCFGITFFAIDFLWIFSLFRFAGWWTVLGWVSAVLFQTLFMLLFAFLFRLLRTANVLWTAFLWVAVEWIRGWGPLGVPLGVLGYSQVPFLPIVQAASFSSVYGISFLIILVNIALANMLHKRSVYHQVIFCLVITLILGVIGWGSLLSSSARIKNAPLSQGERVKISIIQPNIDQMDKMNPAKVEEIFTIHENMSRQAQKDKPAIIIWPETSIFSFVLHNAALHQRLIKLAREGHCWLVIGIPDFDNTGAYNAIVSISPSREIVSRYRKERLVPFGEYLPFRRLLFPWLKTIGYYADEFQAGTSQPLPLFAGKARIAAVICSESAFPDLVRKRIDSKTNLILCVTNDGWFGSSSLPYFHLNIGILRAVENRRYFVQAGNTGISALIDPFGRVIKQSRLNEQAILTFQIPLP